MTIEYSKNYDTSIPTMSAARCQKFLLACAHMKVNIRSSITIGGEHYALKSPGSVSMFFTVQIRPSKVARFEELAGVKLHVRGKLMPA